MTFDVKNKRIIVDPNTLMIGELRAVYQKLPTEIAIRALTYVYMASQIHIDAPFFNARADEIDELAWGNAIYGATDKDKSILSQHRGKFKSIVEPYRKAYSIAEVRMLTVFNHKIDDLRDLIENTKPEIVKSVNPTSGVTTFAHNTDAINKVMISIGSLIDTKDKIEAKLRKEMSGKVRAGKKPSRLEKKMSSK